MAIESRKQWTEKRAKKFLRKRLAIEKLVMYAYNGDFDSGIRIRTKGFLLWLFPLATSFVDVDFKNKRVYVEDIEWFFTIKRIFQELSHFIPEYTFTVTVSK